MINVVLWEQLQNPDVRGECFAPHLALMLKSEWHKWCEALSPSAVLIVEMTPEGICNIENVKDPILYDL